MLTKEQILLRKVAAYNALKKGDISEQQYLQLLDQLDNPKTKKYINNNEAINKLKKDLTLV